jgi:hypothetical protein
MEEERRSKCILFGSQFVFKFNIITPLNLNNLKTIWIMMVGCTLGLCNIKSRISKEWISNP